jgi:gamma-glutamyltranspeptidase/glutathione hydrolase
MRARAPLRVRPSRGRTGVAFLLLAPAVLFAACSSADTSRRDPRWPTPARGAVVCEHPIATEVGLEILDRGGNAADAAIASALVLAVVYPQAGNLGGGGFALFVPHSGEAQALDFRETAPLAASPDRYRDANGRRVPERSIQGPLSVAVPGTPAGLYELYESCASKKISFGDLAKPAIDLAERGFHVDAWLAHDLDSRSVRERMNEPARELFYPRGVALREGQVLKQRALAETLSLYANEGPAGFYRGRVAQAIVREIAETSLPRGASESTAPSISAAWLTLDDLARYQAKFRPPLSGWFRGMQIITVPPPSAGGVLLLQVLGILEGLPLDAERRHALEAQEIEREQHGTRPIEASGLDERMTHWWIEALRCAFADRAAYLGDPDFLPPLTPSAERLLSAEWIAARRVEIGEEAEAHVVARPLDHEGKQTTHLSVLDSSGNAVSLTTTINSTFGSGILVRSCGFLLNDEMDDFALEPDAPNLFGLVGGAANAIAPEKRPLSSMAPTVVRDGGHATTMVLGSPGGPRIVSALAEVLVLEQPIADAVRAPRLHQQWNPEATSFEPGFDKDITAALSNRRNQKIQWSRERFGSVQAIWLAEPGAEPVAVSDPRRGGSAGVQGSKPSAPARPPPPVDDGISSATGSAQ